MPLQSFFIRAFTLLFLSTVSTHAALVSCATSSNPTMCSLCDVFVTGNTIVNYFSGILLPIALVTLTIGGVMYLIGKVDQAKSILTASVLGIILSLSAFLIVNITMRALSIPQTSWNTFTCTNQVAATPSPKDGTTFNTTGDGGPKDTVGTPGDISGDPTITPTTPICNENRDTSNIPLSLPLTLTLDCSHPENIVSAIWRFPSDSNFRSQTVDNKESITFTTIDNPSSWNEVTVVVRDTQGRTQTYTYGFGGSTAGLGGDDLLVVDPSPSLYYNLGHDAAVAVLQEGFIKHENLNWAQLCAASGPRDLPNDGHLGPNGPARRYDHYLARFEAHLEVYAVDVPDSPTWAFDFNAVGLAWSSSWPVYAFVSNTPCAGTAPWVYYYGGGIGGIQGYFTPQNYTGRFPSNVRVKPGRWYVTILWGGTGAPAPTSQLYPDYVNRTLRGFVRFFSRISNE